MSDIAGAGKGEITVQSHKVKTVTEALLWVGLQYFDYQFDQYPARSGTGAVFLPHAETEGGILISIGINLGWTYREVLGVELQKPMTIRDWKWSRN